MIAYQNDLACRVADRVRGYTGGLAQQHIEVQLVESDQPALLARRPAGFRGSGGEQRQCGMKGERGNPETLYCWLRDDRDSLPRLAVPQADCLIIAFRGQQTPVRGENDSKDRCGVPFERA